MHNDKVSLDIGDTFNESWCLVNETCFSSTHFAPGTVPGQYQDTFVKSFNSQNPEMGLSAPTLHKVRDRKPGGQVHRDDTASF